MLTYTDLLTDLYRLCGATSSTARSDIQDAVKSAVRRAQERFCLYGDWSFLHQYQDVVYIPLGAPYNTGTVDVTLDSKTVSGTSTTFTLDMEGSFFHLLNKEFYEIRTYTSATSIALAIPYQSATATAQSYEILKRFYPLPLNFLRPIAVEASLITPGSSAKEPIKYNREASFSGPMDKNKPSWFGIVGNTRRTDYFNTGTVTITTVGTTSTWTISTGTLPTDIVDREARVSGESRSYRIATRASATTFTTYDTYVNPSDSTNTLSSASSYAITPKETQLVGFSCIPDQRYIFELPYIKKLPDLIKGTDISEIVQAGYEDAFLSLCRELLARDGRVAMKGDLVESLINSSQIAMAEAWTSELQAQTAKDQASGRMVDRRQLGPAWI